MKKQLLIFTSLILCISCASQKKEVIAKSTIKLEGRSTNIRDLLDIDGHFYIDPSNKQDGNIMFFDDGSWVYFHFKKGLSEDEIKTNLTTSISNFKNDRYTQWGIFWGVYAIQNDTITVHSYDKPGFLKAWELTEDRYKVIDRQTIKRIFFKVLTDDNYYKSHSPWLDYNPAHFIPADSLPSSDNWLKEEKWIWRNESDWKAYMDRIKAMKKKKK